MKDISNVVTDDIIKSKACVASKSSGALPAIASKYNDKNGRKDKLVFKNRISENLVPNSQSERNIRSGLKYNSNTESTSKGNRYQGSGFHRNTSNDDSFWKTRSSITDDNDWGSSPLNVKTPIQLKTNQGYNRSFDVHQQQRHLHSTSSLNNKSYGNKVQHFNRSSTYNKKYADADNWFSVAERSSEYESQIFQQGSMKSGINFDKYDDIPVKLEGKDVTVKPCLDINDCNLADVFSENLTIAGYTKLTPIQKYAFPCLIEKHDLLGCAQTGSGKTVAFVLPILHHIYKEGYYSPKSSYSPRVAVCMPKALILAPTRELATQIHEVAVKFSYRTMIKPAVVYGGVSIKSQYMSLYNSGHMLVGTPGRVFDMFRRGYLSFENCKYVILDEADRMLDMGFEPQINEILTGTNMPSKGERLNCMFSATFHDSVKRLVSNYMNNPYVMITVGKVGGTTDSITQSILDVPPHEKFPKLLEYVKNDDKVLVFTETKFNADRVEMSLYDAGYKVVCIHGDRDQQERDMALSLFKSGRANIMIATGVASRGLDIPDVKRVVLYDCPKNIDDYIHRIGRTGRAGNTGEAITFYSSLETSIGRELVDLLLESKQQVPEFLKIDARYGGGNRNSGVGNFHKSNASNYRRGSNYRPSGSYKKNDFDGKRGSRNSYSSSNQNFSFSSNRGMGGERW